MKRISPFILTITITSIACGASLTPTTSQVNQATLAALHAAALGACSGVTGVSLDGTIFYAPGTNLSCQTAAQAAFAAVNQSAIAAGLTIQQQYDALVAAGITATSTMTPTTSGVFAISGTFADGTDVMAAATGVYMGLKVGDPLPGGGSTFNWSDINGSPHQFTAAQFEALFLAIKNYRYQLSQAAVAGGISWPSPNVTIP